LPKGIYWGIYYHETRKLELYMPVPAEDTELYPHLDFFRYFTVEGTGTVYDGQEYAVAMKETDL